MYMKLFSCEIQLVMHACSVCSQSHYQLLQQMVDHVCLQDFPEGEGTSKDREACHKI